MRTKLEQLRDRLFAGIPEAVAAIEKARDEREDQTLTDQERERLAALMDEQASVKQQIEDQERMQALLIANDRAPKRADSSAGRIEVVERELSFGEYAQMVAQASTPGRATPPRLAEFQAAATGLSQGVPSEGGYLVDPQFSSTIMDEMRTQPVNLMGMCDSYPISGESLTLKAVKHSDQSDGTVAGGIQGYWLAEADQMTASAPKFRDLRLEPHQMGVLIYVTDKLLANAAALETFLRRRAAEAIVRLSNKAILRGDGSGKPQGILNAGALVTVAKEPGQEPDSVNADNISKLWGRLHPNSRGNAVWLINHEVEEQLDRLSFDLGTSGQLVYLGAGGLQNPTPMRLKGRPVVVCDICSALGDVGDVLLVDMSMYALGLRAAQGVQSAMSIHLRFNFNETAFRFLFEVDGQSWLEAAVTPEFGTSGNTLSPFVTLAARA